MSMNLSDLPCDCLPAHGCNVVSIGALPACSVNGRVYTVTADPSLDRPTPFMCWGGKWVAMRLRDGHYCHVYRAASVSVNGSASETITFDTVAANDDTLYTEHDDKIVTVAERDLWEFLGRCQVDYGASVGSVSLNLIINGSAIEIDSENESSDGFLSVVWKNPSSVMAAGSTVQLRIDNNASGAVTISNVNLLVSGRDHKYMTS